MWVVEHTSAALVVGGIFLSAAGVHIVDSILALLLYWLAGWLASWRFAMALVSKCAHAPTHTKT